ncbi:MAG: hypothetical protein HY017_07700 [Betaproteobacteria bacterium]|nr:hypothetical protein [Betaproteobacteria bacterium]
MNATNKSVEQMVAAIQALELEPIKVKLMDPEGGQGWSREYADRMELAYTRFLTLLVKFPDETIAPTKDVDKFWHGHILDTLKYAEDCQNVFGYFLHHFPYFGMRGEEDAANSRAAAENMHRIYEREFGERLPNGGAWCVVAKPSMKPESAWCVVAKPSMKPESAWCVAAKPSMKPESAWCVAAKPSMKPESAWCVAAEPSMKPESAWCVAATPRHGTVDVTVRPTLASVN